MKKIIQNLKYLALASVVITAVSCDDSDDNNNVLALDNSAYDLTVSNVNFSLLNAAILRTDLELILDYSGEYTVFAPTDIAFQDFLDDNNFASIDDVPVDVLRNTLLNHVLDTEVTSSALVDGYVKTSATNADGDNLDMYVDITSGVILNGDAGVTGPDNTVSNGVVHVVDEVIALPTVVTLAAANPAFSNLVAAVSQEELVGTLSNQAANLTVFAPLNTSFDALVTEDPLSAGWTSVNDVLALGDGSSSMTSTLDDVLLYHVLTSGAVRAEDITDGITPATAQGDNLTINIATDGTVNITDGNGRVLAVIVTDVTAINGVVHAIDNVLLP